MLWVDSRIWMRVLGDVKKVAVSKLFETARIGG
jgi:hypothetical protein